MFRGMEKLGPGGDPHTVRAVRSLPKKQFRLVVTPAAARAARPSRSRSAPAIDC
jgi:hypothetical protein